MPSPGPAAGLCVAPMNDGKQLNSPEMWIMEVGLNISQKNDVFNEKTPRAHTFSWGGGAAKTQKVTDPKLLEFELSDLG